MRFRDILFALMLGEFAGFSKLLARKIVQLSCQLLPSDMPEDQRVIIAQGWLSHHESTEMPIWALLESLGMLCNAARTNWRYRRQAIRQDDLLPEEAQILKPNKRKKRWKGVILDDDEYVLRVLYTSFRWPLLLWLSSIVLLVGISQLILPLRFGAVLGMLVASGMLVHWWYTRRWAWAATNRRVISRLGFLNKQGSSVSYTRVTDIDVYRPFMSQLFGNGKVLVNTVAGSGDNLSIYDQANPESIEALIREVTDWAQSEEANLIDLDDIDL